MSTSKRLAPAWAFFNLSGDVHSRSNQRAAEFAREMTRAQLHHGETGGVGKLPFDKAGTFAIGSRCLRFLGLKLSPFPLGKMGGGGTWAARLWRLPVEREDFLCADVVGHHWLVVRGKAQ